MLLAKCYALAHGLIRIHLTRHLMRSKHVLCRSNKVSNPDDQTTLYVGSG